MAPKNQEPPVTLRWPSSVESALVDKPGKEKTASRGTLTAVEFAQAKVAHDRALRSLRDSVGEDRFAALLGQPV